MRLVEHAAFVQRQRETIDADVAVRFVHGRLDREALIPVWQRRQDVDARVRRRRYERFHQRCRAERARAQIRWVVEAQDEQPHAASRHCTRVLTWPPSKRNLKHRLATETPKRGCHVLESTCNEAPVASSSTS